MRLEFSLPSSKYGKQWMKIFDTSHYGAQQEEYNANDILMAEGPVDYCTSAASLAGKVQ